MSDFARYLTTQDCTARWRAEHENTAARLELALRDERAAMLVSQNEPVASLGLDRERLRLVLAFLSNGDLARLHRELENL